jgi:3-deoxy-7-phosphoheptulonate synthase
MSESKSIAIGDLFIGDGSFAVIAGPCSIESETHFQTVADFVAAQGASLLRGGIFKLRTNPQSFQGLESAGYEIARNVKRIAGLGLVSEITDPRQIEAMESVVDAFQVGSRNMHNYALLKELGRTRKPVVLKRGFAGLVHEWLLSAEYVRKHGNPNVILCERGIRTFETVTRNTLDLNAVVYVKQHSDLPVLVDPSHGTGVSELVTPMALASAAAGADGIMVEVHPQPDKALSDGFQALDFAAFADLMKRLNALLPALGRHLALPNQRSAKVANSQPSFFESRLQL